MMTMNKPCTPGISSFAVFLSGLSKRNHSLALESIAALAA
jgi:hypothetical protein